MAPRKKQATGSNPQRPRVRGAGSAAAAPTRISSHNNVLEAIAELAAVVPEVVQAITSDLSSEQQQALNLSCRAGHTVVRAGKTTISLDLNGEVPTDDLAASFPNITHLGLTMGEELSDFLEASPGLLPMLRTLHLRFDDSGLDCELVESESEISEMLGSCTKLSELRLFINSGEYYEDNYEDMDDARLVFEAEPGTVLTDLDTLFAAPSNVHSILKSKAACKYLRKVMGYHEHTTDLDVTTLAKAANLRELELVAVRLDEEASDLLAALPQVEKVSLDYSICAQCGWVGKFKKCNSIKDLTITSMHIDVMARLCTGLPHLQVLRLLEVGSFEHWMVSEEMIRSYDFPSDFPKKLEFPALEHLEFGLHDIEDHDPTMHQVMGAFLRAVSASQLKTVKLGGDVKTVHMGGLLQLMLNHPQLQSTLVYPSTGDSVLEPGCFLAATGPQLMEVVRKLPDLLSLPLGSIDEEAEEKDVVTVVEAAGAGLHYLNLMTGVAYDAISVSDTLLESLAASCPNLRVLRAGAESAKGFTSAGVKGLAVLKELQHLHLRECESLDDATVEALLKQCVKLKSLGLDGLQDVSEAALLSLCTRAQEHECGRGWLWLPDASKLTDEGVTKLNAAGWTVRRKYCAYWQSGVGEQ